MKTVFGPFVTGSRGRVAWTSNWVSFIDTLLQFELISIRTRELRLPTYVKEVVIDPALHRRVIGQQHNPKDGMGGKGRCSTQQYRTCGYNSATVITSAYRWVTGVAVDHYEHAKVTQSGGVTVSGLRVTPAPLRKNAQPPPTLERQLFVPHVYTVTKTYILTNLSHAMRPVHGAIIIFGTTNIT